MALACVKPANQVYQANLLNARPTPLQILYFIKLVSTVQCYKNDPVNHYFSAVIRRGFMQLDDGWISPLNGFQYKFITLGRDWQYSRSVCQGMGGDLATHGLQDWGIRRYEFKQWLFQSQVV